MSAPGWHVVNGGVDKTKKPGNSNDDAVGLLGPLKGRYCFIRELNLFKDLLTGSILEQSAIDRTHASLDKGVCRSLLSLEYTEIVDSLTWFPNKPQIFTDGSRTLLNEYTPSGKTPVPGDVSQFEIHAEHIIPDHDAREIILDWMAHTVQYQDIKINYQLLIGGDQGTGKDALILPLRTALGFHNCGMVEPLDLEGQFTDYLSGKKLIILNEFRAFRDRKLENRLKAMTASPPEELSINPKGSKRYKIPNLVHLIAMSNHRSQALTLSKGDRRWFAYWSPAKPLAPSYYKELYEWLNNGGSSYVFDWLLSRDISCFDAYAPAPDTAYKQELIDVSEDPVSAKLREMIEDCVSPFDKDLVHMDAILEALNDPRLDSGKVGGLLHDLGCLSDRPGRKSDDGKKVFSVRLWVVRNIKEYEKLNRTERYRRWEYQN